MIRLGYELGTGYAVDIPLRHTAVTGQTQESGKTTTLEALITRSGLRAVAFITKRGEKSFRVQTPVAPYFREPALTPESPMWRWVESIFETIGESVGRDDKALLIRCSNYVLEAEKYKAKGETRVRVVDSAETVETLAQVAANVRLMLAHARGRDAKTLTCLDAYFKIVMPQIARMRATGELKLASGINVMDIEGLTTEMQMLIIRSVLETVYSERRSTVVIIPEAWKFIPRMRNSPVRFAAEIYIRQGLALKNILMLDSQDLANIGTEVLKSIGVWILGKQSEINEVKRVVDYIPAIPRIPRESIMQLGKGEFYVVAEGKVKKCYVQPAGMEDLHAQAIARGEESADSWRQIERNLPKTEAQPDAEAIGATEESETLPVRMADESEDDEMWKERCEQAEAEVARLRAEVAKLMRVIQNGVEQSITDLDTDANVSLSVERRNAAIPGGEHCSDVDAMPAAPLLLPRGDAAAVRLADNGPGKHRESVETVAIAGFTDAGYTALRARLLSDPGVLVALEATRPEIHLHVERPKLEMDTKGDKGRLALLLHEGFFAKPRPIAEATEEFRRRGWMGAAGRPRPLNVRLGELATMGFLTVEANGYQAVPGMKVSQSER